VYLSSFDTKSSTYPWGMPTKRLAPSLSTLRFQSHKEC
jgi:hypothetical protein